MINVEEIKSKILKILDLKGPSLPLQIAKATEISPIFASAILSEMVGERKVKMSKLKFGSTPLYLIPGQEQKLEAFANENLSKVEKLAYNKLKDEKIIDDITQEPSIRVALRSINDFATPIRYQDKIIWKYAFISNEEARQILSERYETPNNTNKQKHEEEVKEEMPQKIETSEEDEEGFIEIKKIPEKKIVEEKEEIVEKTKITKAKKKQDLNEEFLVELK
jgi:hypothetical protein